MGTKAGSRKGTSARQAEYPWFGIGMARSDFAGVGKEPDGKRWNDCHSATVQEERERESMSTLAEQLVVALSTAAQAYAAGDRSHLAQSFGDRP